MIFIALRRLWNRPLLTLLSIAGVILAVGLVTSIPIFSQSVSFVMLNEELQEISAKTKRPLFSMRVYVLPSARYQLPLTQTRELADLIEGTLDHLDTYIPNIRQRLAHVEAATPKTFRHYTQHVAGASFGTKFEGLGVSNELSEHVKGLWHSGSVGIIMSGWLGSANYGAIVANKVDAFLHAISQQTA